jgi:formate dehydrogenase (NADP+) beta subunit
VIIAVGAKSSRGLGLPGERGPRVYGGVDLLRAVALGRAVSTSGRDVVVIGGGNVAYDVARTRAAPDRLRHGAHRRPPARHSRACLVSLEGLEEMPADTVEIVEGDEEGIERLNGWGPVEIVRDEAGRVTGVPSAAACACTTRTAASPPLRRQRRSPSRATRCCSRSASRPQLELPRGRRRRCRTVPPGWPKTDPKTLATTAPGVFVAGRPRARHAPADRRRGLRQGRRALGLRVSDRPRSRPRRHLAPRAGPLPARARLRIDPPRARCRCAIPRSAWPTRTPWSRSATTREQAMREASRCLDCGVTPVFDGSAACCAAAARTSAPRVPEARAAERHGPHARISAPPSKQRSVRRSTSAEHSAILKDEDRCIRCAACAMRCPVDAITMERVSFCTTWRTYDKPMPNRRVRGSIRSRCRAATGSGSVRCGPWAPRCYSATVGMLKLPKAAVLASPSKKFRVALPETLPPGEAVRAAGPAVAVFRDAEGVYASPPSAPTSAAS